MSTPDTTSVNGQARVPPRLLIARVFFTFAGGFFVSYVYRTINAVLAPEIAVDLGLSATDIGLLTSMYFLSFAAFQLPLGILLDRFGPRRVEAVLLVVAALGAVLFATLDSLAGLALGRALIGVGVSCCLMAGFKAFALWFPDECIPTVNGFMLTFGGLGALVATVPIELLLQVTDWRALFLGLAAATVLLAVTVLLIVPEHPGAVTETRVRHQLDGLKQVFRDRFFWRVTPATAIAIGVALSIQSLWAGPWLRDVQGLDQLAVARHLMVIAGTSVFAYPIIGMSAQLLARIGVTTATVAGVGMSAFIPVVATMASGAVTYHWALMVVFGFLAAFATLSYALLGQHFPPELVGRANTAMNVLVFATAFAMQWGLGAIIGQWDTSTIGAYDPAGYQVGFGLLAVLQMATMIWFFFIARRAGSR